MTLGSHPRAVTFDCWSTLLYEREPYAAHEARVRVLFEIVSVHASKPISEPTARRAYDLAWERHWEAWVGGRATGSTEIAAWALESLEIDSAGCVEELAGSLSGVALDSEIVALEGAGLTLQWLRDADVQCALVCDTGLSPGSVVRQILEREGLLEYLEVLVFSDEAGVPKPHPRVFEHALHALGVAPHEAIHVGDLRRTDVVGARAVGMRTVRIRHHHDDLTDHPEADHVVDSHDHLCELLRIVPG